MVPESLALSSDLTPTRLQEAISSLFSRVLEEIS